MSSQRGIVKTPVLQVIRVPFPDGEVYSKLHPMPLGFVVDEHGGVPLPVEGIDIKAYIRVILRTRIRSKADATFHRGRCGNS